MSETVESLVDRYMNDWGYTFAKTMREIKRGWEMSEEEKESAIWWLTQEYATK